MECEGVPPLRHSPVREQPAVCHRPMGARGSWDPGRTDGGTRGPTGARHAPGAPCLRPAVLGRVGRTRVVVNPPTGGHAAILVGWGRSQVVTE